MFLLLLLLISQSYSPISIDTVTFPEIKQYISWFKLFYGRWHCIDTKFSDNMPTVVNNSSYTIYVAVPMQSRDDNGGFYSIQPGHQESWNRNHETMAFVMKGPVEAKQQVKMFGIPSGATIVIEDKDLWKSTLSYSYCGIPKTRMIWGLVFVEMNI